MKISIVLLSNGYIENRIMLKILTETLTGKLIFAKIYNTFFQGGIS